MRHTKLTIVDDTTKLTAGQRIELHPSTGAWMRGDRYATIVGVDGRILDVQYDLSGRHKRIMRRDAYRIVGE